MSAKSEREYSEVYFFRHAESVANTSPEIIGGRSNHSPLSSLGQRQALQLRERLLRERIELDEVYSSPAVRCIQTGKIALPNYSLTIDDRLQELDQGEWTGKNRKEMYTPEAINKMNADHWNFKAQEGESQAEVAKRMKEFLIEKIENADRKIVLGIFGHGGAIKYTLADLFDMNKQIAWRIPIDNTSITCIRYQEGLWIPAKINDSAHLIIN